MARTTILVGFGPGKDMGSVQFLSVALSFHSRYSATPTRRLNRAATSEFGTKRTSRPGRRRSALRGKAEVGVGQLDFRVGPTADLIAVEEGCSLTMFLGNY